jgi:hypothetical protein
LPCSSAPASEEANRESTVPYTWVSSSTSSALSMASCRADPSSRRRSLPTAADAAAACASAPVSEMAAASSFLEDAEDDATSSTSDLASCKVDLEAPVAPAPEGLDEDSKAAAEVSSDDESCCAAAAPPLPRFFLEYSDDKADLRRFGCRIPSARVHALAPALTSAARPGTEPERHDDEEEPDDDGAALQDRRETTGFTATHAHDIPAESYENLISNSSNS